MWASVAALPQSDWVITSPLSRCRLFAEAYGRQHGIDVEIEPLLGELDFGEWEGRSSADIYEDDPLLLEAFWNDPRQQAPPGGEAFADFERRVLTAWHKIRNRTGERILVVTHAGPIRVITLNERGLPFESLLQLPIGHGSVHHFKIVD